MSDEKKKGVDIRAVQASAIAAIAATCQLEENDVRPGMSIDDLGLGSMGLVAVISRLEALHEIELDTDHVVSLLQTTTVGEFAEQVSNLLCEKQMSGAPA